MAIDLAVAHLRLPAVCEQPLFGLCEVTSKMNDGGDVLVGRVGGVACQHSNSKSDIRSGGHHEIYELADGRLEGSD